MSKHAHKQKRDITSRAELVSMLQQKESAMEATQELLDRMAHASATPLTEAPRLVQNNEPRQPEETKQANERIETQDDIKIAESTSRDVGDAYTQTIDNFQQVLDIQQQMVGTMLECWSSWMTVGLGGSGKVAR